MATVTGRHPHENVLKFNFLFIDKFRTTTITTTTSNCIILLFI